MTDTAVVLIVDDEERNRRLLQMMLQAEGYVTLLAGDGREALDTVALNDVDLILLDVAMPGMNGYEVARILKKDPSWKQIPIIMVTAHIDRQTRIAALESGVEEFLTKPVDRAELWLRVRNLLRLKEYGDLLTDYNSTLEQRVAERAADLHRFRLAMDSTADAIFLTDRATMRFVEVNATASSMFGYTREELLSMGPAELNGASRDDLAAGFDALIGDSSGAVLQVVLRRKDGTEFPVEVSRHARETADGWLIVGVLRDVTERVAADERLQQLAHYDPLTGLPNRRLFYESLHKTLAFAASSDLQVAVMFLDVDHFKKVNDTLGHAVGDRLLAQIGDRLVGCIRSRDTVGRLGGDEFGLILAQEHDAYGAAAVAGKVRDAMRPPFELDGSQVSMTVSIGITMFPEDAEIPETLVKYADTAMYGAKQVGRDTYRFFTPLMNSDVMDRLRLEQALRSAVDRSEFVLHYQPKVRPGTQRVVGLEALLRWDRPGHGLVPPDAFIPALEETGLIREVGVWVINEACRQIAEWTAGDVGARRVAVNVSGRQFVDGDLDHDIGVALAAHGVSAEFLELEITESSLMANTHRTLATLQRLKARGVRISIDDFGTGFSSLAYLRQFPVDTLKIDIAFIRNVTTSVVDAAMTEMIIRMAHTLEMDVVAEGVETAAQLAFLTEHGCDEIQGYYFSRPLPVPDLEILLRRGAVLALDDVPADLSVAMSRDMALSDECSGPR
jgi:diguanylate cyclase (GGDEF)-like protein/PAS domain S-box-containing protein